jgi:hypothetical protein
MGAQLKAGVRLRSATDTTEVVVVRAPSEPVDLRCGGHPFNPIGTEQTELVDATPGLDQGTEIGKRYGDDGLGLELLCTNAGSASISVGSEKLAIKVAKPLPSSD